MFSTIVIHGSRISSNGLSFPLSLISSPSFPASAYHLEDELIPLPDTWDAKDSPTADGRLELRLVDRIAEGRIGVVYSARLVAATRAGTDVASSLPATLCVKVAKKHHCRSLAREAWFYEQLTECQGISVPQCYGFYSSIVGDQHHPEGFLKEFLPWNDLRPAVAPHPSIREWSPSLDWLDDDQRPTANLYKDNRRFKMNSPWYSWNCDEGNPTVAILVTELLGDACAKSWSFGEDRPDLHKELVDVLEDTCEAGLLHADVTAWNLLRFDGEEGPDRHCHRHGVMHRWRVIDFDRSDKIHLANTNWKGKYAIKIPLRAVGRPNGFWGEVW